ncbi:MAG: ATP-grasp domain-containing protein [Acidobacteriota bacterium]|nr:ATP-grasp domain-containing protein [Acidobacteriota bacterium]
MALIPTVLIFEYFSGGGCPEGRLPEGLASEAFGMLWAVLQDFKDWGTVRTVTALDPRFEQIMPNLSRATLPADEVYAARPGDHENVYLSLLKRCEAVLIIAPETDGILSTLAELAEAEGKHILGSSSTATAAAGNKAVSSRLFDLAGLPAPETCVASFAAAPQVASRLGCPLVIKPLDGVGSEGVFRLDRISDLPAALARIRQSTIQEQIVLQTLAQGIPASVSLLVAGERCLPLSLNRQLMDAELPFQYRGSQVPFTHPSRERALDLACRAVRLIPGLNGYVGVDVVLGEEDATLIEINPRLTTSYIGLRQVARANLAQAMWAACIEGTLPDCIPLEGAVQVQKDDPATWNLRLAP